MLASCSNAERLTSGEWDHRVHRLQPAPEHVQRVLRPRDVGDDEVEHPLARLQAGGLSDDRGGREAGQLGEHLGSVNA